MRRVVQPADFCLERSASCVAAHNEMHYSFQVYLLSRYLFDHEGPALFGKAVTLALEGASPDELFALANRVPRSIEGIEAAYLEYRERGE